jgi:hypothetical protein
MKIFQRPRPPVAGWMDMEAVATKGRYPEWNRRIQPALALSWGNLGPESGGVPGKSIPPSRIMAISSNGELVVNVWGVA